MSADTSRESLPSIQLNVKTAKLNTGPLCRWVSKDGIPVECPEDFGPDGEYLKGEIYYQRLDTGEVLNRNELRQLWGRNR